jgi:uncharacterized Fe-S cluster protein YjdI
VTIARPPEDSRRGRASAAPEVTVFSDRGRCRHDAAGVGGLPQGFDPTRRPWIRADLADAQAVAEVVRRCPTGALHDRLLAGEPEGPTHPTIIAADPRGPLLVRGDLVLDTPQGPLRETRVALCACGRTHNQPFCDGACGVNAGPPAAPGTRGTRWLELAASRPEVEDDLAVTVHMPLAANGGERSLLLEAHRGEDLASIGERIPTLAAQPLEIAGLVATLAKVEPLLQAVDELLPTRMADGELVHGALPPSSQVGSLAR